MDFTPSEEQQAARDLAARIFDDLSTHERLTAAGTGTDAELWKRLAEAGLLEAVEDIGLLGLVLLLEEQGRTTAQVPLAVTGVFGLLATAAFGSDKQGKTMLPGLRNGSVVATGAFSATGGGLVRAAAEEDSNEGSLSGVVPLVPWLRDATHVLVPDADRTLWVVRTEGAGVAVEAVETTAPWSAGRLTLTGARGERLGGPGPGVHERAAGTEGRAAGTEGRAPGTEGRAAGTKGRTAVTEGRAEGANERAAGTEERVAGAAGRTAGAYEWIRGAARIAFAGLQAGVCAGSVARAVAYTSQREQFGRPLATKQGVQLRAADAHMDTEAIRVTAYEAAWRYDQGLAHATHALTAAWWASEAGRRVVHAGQHLHGGLGADLAHPVHRHFLWGRQIDAYLGGGGQALEELGGLLVDGEGSAE